MSVASAQPSSGGIPAGPPAAAPGGEACPLCGAPLHPEQGWCLACGAAARTRLAASPGWKGPIGAFAVVLALALAVLAAALVDLAGGSGATAPAVTTTVTTPAATAPTTSTTATAPSASQPGASTSPTTTSTSKTGTPGAKTMPTTTTTTTPGLTHTSPVPTTGSTGVPKLSPKAKSEIAKAIRERLGKLGVGKVLPTTPSK